jgi:hypothetical protein
MPTQFDPFVQVAGFIRALTNLHDNVVQNTQDWMTELQRTLDNSSREFAAAMAQFEKEQDEVFKVIALGGHGTSFHILAGPCRPSVAQCGRRRRDEQCCRKLFQSKRLRSAFRNGGHVIEDSLSVASEIHH